MPTDDRGEAEISGIANPHGRLPRPAPGDTTPTFPSEAESLLRDLKLGAARSAPPPFSDDLPRIPNYEIESELGRGGMGVVYKARHVSLNRTVALKMILTSTHTAAGELTRFLAEAEAIAAVKHPNVVEVYDLGDANGRPYFAMEHVGGGSLAGLLKTGGPLAPRRAAALIAEVAGGVQAAHDAGIVHRDLKPANILLAVGSGQRAAGSEDMKQQSSSLLAAHSPLPTLGPKVSDFGLAKRLASDLTRTQAVMGTPAYMAPEQAGGKAKFVGPAADVYALGVILYECLTGQVPFESPDTWALIRQVLEDAPTAPRTHTPDLPRDLELICLKCLEKEPHHRYPTAAALAQDLNRFLQGEPVSVRPIGTATRVARWAKRHPAPAALFVLLALLLFIVPPLVVWEQGRLDRRDAVAEEARQKEDAANRAKDEAEKARIAAEQLAQARELFALQNQLRNRSVARPVGWTRETLSELPRAVTLAANDPAAVRELRSAAADVLLAADLFPREPIHQGFTASAAATDPKTGLIALGQFHAWVLRSGHVWLVDPATGRVARELKFPAGIVRTTKGDVRTSPDSVRSLAFSPDGSRLYVGLRSSSVVRFDLDKPENTPAAVWKASISAVEQLAVSRDGNIVYGLCRPEVPVFAWNAETGKLIAKLEPDDARQFGAFTLLRSGDVVAGNHTHLYHWDASHKLLGKAPLDGSFRLTATDGSLLLVGSGVNLHLYDQYGFSPTDQFSDPKLRRSAHTEFIREVVVHPSGAYAATSASEGDRKVRVWELASGRLIGTVTSPGTGPFQIAWSGDGRYLVATAMGSVARWEFVPAPAERFSYLSAPAVGTATFLPNARVATLGELTDNRRELLVELEGNRKFANWLMDSGDTGLPGLASEPSGTLAATLKIPGIFHWTPGTNFPPMAFTKRLARCPRFSPDGKILWAIVGSQEVHSYDPTMRNLLGKWSNSTAEIVSGLGSLDALAVSSKSVVAGGMNGSVYVLDAATCTLATVFPRSGDPVQAVAITPDNSLIVAGTQKGLLRVMNPATKAELPPVQAHSDDTTAVAINHDGTLLATGSRDRSVRLWKRNGDRFEPLLTVSDLPTAVRELQFAQGDDRLLVLLAHSHAARVWDISRLKSQLTDLKLGW